MMEVHYDGMMGVPMMGVHYDILLHTKEPFEFSKK